MTKQSPPAHADPPLDLKSIRGMLRMGVTSFDKFVVLSLLAEIERLKALQLTTIEQGSAIMEELIDTVLKAAAPDQETPT